MILLNSGDVVEIKGKLYKVVGGSCYLTSADINDIWPDVKYAVDEEPSLEWYSQTYSSLKMAVEFNNILLKQGYKVRLRQMGERWLVEWQ